MDLRMILSRIEANFFDRLNKNAYWGEEEVKREFNDAVKDILILTYSRVMKDAKEAKDGS